jgi:hypothetical protein
MAPSISGSETCGDRGNHRITPATAMKTTAEAAATRNKNSGGSSNNNKSTNKKNCHGIMQIRPKQK